MRAAILALLVVCTQARAETWLEMPNQAGGKILLLTSKCEGKNEGRLVIGTSSDGTNVHGCWYYFADMVHVVWNTGKTSSFNPSDFTARERK